MSKTKTKRTRNRYQVKFWLDAARDDDLILLDTIDDLKRNRSFTQTIRDGIRLILDLRKGRVDVLLELFPTVHEAFSKPDAPDSGGGGMDELRDRLDAIQSALLQSHAPGGLIMAAKQMHVPQFAAPGPDDDLLEITKSAPSSSAATNMVNSMMSMMQSMQQSFDAAVRDLQAKSAPQIVSDDLDINIFAAESDHADPTEARENFSAGMGDLFADDDDDLWD